MPLITSEVNLTKNWLTSFLHFVATFVSCWRIVYLYAFAIFLLGPLRFSYCVTSIY